MWLTWSQVSVTLISSKEQPMSTISQSPSPARTIAERYLWKPLHRSFKTNRPLTVLGVGSLGLLVMAIMGLIIDHQVITGMPAFDKPLKFAISSSIYAFTLAYLLTFITRRQGDP